MTEQSNDNDAEWLFLIDPGWQPADEDDRPPAHAVLGGWFVDTDGTAGEFQPNPDYRPADERSFIDPIDATLRLVLEQRAEPGQLLATLRGAVVGVAVDENGNPVVAASPDQIPCVLVTSAPEHRRHAQVEGWTEISMAELAAALPEEGIDVLINPGAPASMRLLAGAVKAAVAVAT
ncbi:type VII secretion system-associated protein [Nocardia amamiensis]|uniref:type VII secretion system-associated protein n=1 Tax=Nocardia TaxID=1817 RepID=UPI0033ED64AF